VVAVQDFRPGRSRHFKSALTFGSSFNRSALNSQRLGVFLSREMKAERVVVRDEFPLFDWLRFALASAVALTHEGVIPWDTAANLAVQIFFALSGWLIGGILLRTDVQHLPRFYFNRATRIWIPYLFAVAALYLLAALREPVTASTFRYLAYDLTFTHNWFVTAALMPSMPLQGTGAHFWSIAVEEQFYLAAPLLILLTPFGRSVLAWAAIAAFVALAHSWFGSISFGVLAAVARRRFGDWQQTRAGAIIVAAGTAATAATVLALPSYYNLLCPLLAIGVVLLTSWPAAKLAVSWAAYPTHSISGIGRVRSSFTRSESRHLGLPISSRSQSASPPICLSIATSCACAVSSIAQQPGRP
jgi:peptidoglycan/LPS O-acetylase OafA/YrhL